MSQRDDLRPNDFQRMCKQAERDQESRKLVILMEKVQRQLREHGQEPAVNSPKRPATVSRAQTIPSRSSFFER